MLIIHNRATLAKDSSQNLMWKLIFLKVPLDVALGLDVYTERMPQRLEFVKIYCERNLS